MEFLTLLIPATLVLLLGGYDDLRGANATVKFVGLGLIATLFNAMGGRIDALSIPLVGSVQLPPLVSFVITVVWLVGITNAFNLIDGLDGLASGAALFSSLVILGVSISQERTLMIVVCALFGLVALIFPATGSKLTGFMLFVISVAVIIAVGHLRYHEVDELRAGVKRTVGDRRLRVANNIRVRRAALALSRASDLHEMFEVTRTLLDFGEFSSASVQVGLPNERVNWFWSREAEGDSHSPSDWSIRLPLVKDGVEWGWLNLYRTADSEPLLVDTNYLSDLFRREFTEAVARILTQHEAPVAAKAMAMTAESAR